MIKPDDILNEKETFNFLKGAKRIRVKIAMEEFAKKKLEESKAGQHEPIVMLRNKIKAFKDARESADNCADMLLSNPTSDEPARLMEELEEARQELYKEVT